MPIQASRSQRRVMQHVVSEVPHHIPFEPGQPADVGRVRLFGGHALPKDVVCIIAENVPRQMSRVAPMHLTSLEWNEVIGRMLKRALTGLPGHIGGSGSRIIVDTGWSGFLVAH